MSFSGPDRSPRPIRRLRVVPNPVASAHASAVVAGSAAGPGEATGSRGTVGSGRAGGRHRKYDPDDEPDVGSATGDAAATTDVVPAQRAAWLTVPPPVGGTPWPPGA